MKAHKRYQYRLMDGSARLVRAKVHMMTRQEVRSANKELAVIPWGTTLRYRKVRK